MLIDLRELLSGTKEEMEVSANIEMEKFKTSRFEYDFISKEPVVIKLTKLDKNVLKLEGSAGATIAIPCDRCLKPVPTEFSFDFTKDIDLSKEPDRIEDEEEQDYIDGYNLNVDELVFSEILLRMPSKTLCSENCKGLCPRCGADLNVKECGCDRESLDPRMSVFKDILNNFKEV